MARAFASVTDPLFDESTSYQTPPFNPTETISIRQLPAPPPTKRPTAWDKAHISETLARIGQGFFGSQNFGEGLGNAAAAIAGRAQDLRAEQAKSTTFGGPNGQFEITTDAYGNKSYREVPEFAKAVAAAKLAPDATAVADRRSRAVYAISQLPQDKRAAAYAGLIANPAAYNVDVAGMPGEWSDDYGTVGGLMGMSVDKARAQDRSDTLADDTIRHRRVGEAQGEARVAQGQARVAQGAQRVSQAAQKLRTPPRSARKPKVSAANADLSYLLR